jgi:hypothetical protein
LLLFFLILTANMRICHIVLKFTQDMESMLWLDKWNYYNFVNETRCWQHKSMKWWQDTTFFVCTMKHLN